MIGRAMAAVFVAALLMVGAPADAGGGRGAMRKQVESSLQVSGTITIGTDGSVLAHEIDPKAPLGESLTRFVDASVAKWRFVPVLVDGKAVNAKVPMHLRLVATPADNGMLNVRIASTYFGSSDQAPATDSPRSLKLDPPMYPMGAQMAGGKGTVYLIVQIGRDGKVINVDAEQVNLRVVGTERQMADLRKAFTDASVRAARRWTFAIPTTGEEATKDSWLARVPVDYTLSRPGKDEGRGKTTWDSYIPGPRNYDMPWAGETLRTAGNPDAMPDGGVYPLEQGATLLTPPPAT